MDPRTPPFDEETRVRKATNTALLSGTWVDTSMITGLSSGRGRCTATADICSCFALLGCFGGLLWREYCGVKVVACAVLLFLDILGLVQG
jgi:hypothetical protein